MYYGCTETEQETTKKIQSVKEEMQNEKLRNKRERPADETIFAFAKKGAARISEDSLNGLFSSIQPSKGV
jgi:hypothetical protein